MTDPPRIKGYIVAARFDFLEEHAAPGAVERMLRVLPEQDRACIARLGRDDWWPFETLLRIDRAIAELFEPNDPSVFDRLGVVSARHWTRWAGEHASLISAHAFLSGIAERHRQIHNFGRAAYRMLGFTEAELQFSEYPEADPIWCRSAAGFFGAAVGVFARSSVRVEEPLCQCRGDVVCLFRVRWGGEPQAGPR